MPILDFALLRNYSRLAARCQRGYRNWMEETSFKGLIANTEKGGEERCSPLGLGSYTVPADLACVDCRAAIMKNVPS
jgi:hypothetical protein